MADAGKTHGKNRKYGRARKSPSHSRYLAEHRCEANARRVQLREERKLVKKLKLFADGTKTLRGTARANSRHNLTLGWKAQHGIPS